MKLHTNILVPQPALALVRVDQARERSARACALALEGCPASSVARSLGRSEDLVRRWGRGQGSPSLAQILATPERFALRLLALAGQAYEPPSTVVELPPRERLCLLLATLGALMAATPRGLDSLEQYTDDQLAERDRQYRDIEEQAQRERRAIARVRAARAEGPREEKGGPR